METGYRYRLRVTPSQQRALQEVFDSCRFVWNTALGRWTDLWRHEQTHLSVVDMSAELTDWRSRFDWLAAVPVTPQQQMLRALGQAITAFFDRRNPARRPRFKKKGTVHWARWTLRGFSVSERLSVAVSGGRIDLRVVWSRPLPSPPASVTILRDAAGRWWANFVVRIEPEVLPTTGRTTGVDVGLTTLATTSDPVFDVPNMHFSRHERILLRDRDRRLSKTTKDSRRSEKAKRRRARSYATVTNRRADYAHKTTRHIARAFDRIGVEDLRIKNLLANHRLARSISDAGWGDWLSRLDWQARKCGHEVVHLDPRNTTQTCSACGTKAKSRLGLADRTFSCNFCGLVLDRDRNAAHNLNPGWAVPGEGVDGSKPGISTETSAA